ncbi:MAG: iron-sulfur cluster assembly scaffold protein [Geminicoccaceae bacterium]|nr:iron-sulfur cluster assembly scaffold protein [Geminicoccaceae bacterium]
MNDLYDDALVALAKAKDGAGRLDAPDGTASVDNPLCGDRVTIDVTLDGARVDGFAQKARGCILTQAAAGMIARHAHGLDAGDIEALRARVRDFLSSAGDGADWPEMALFEPVRTVRSRHDCVLIAFDALLEATRKARDERA